MPEFTDEQRQQFWKHGYAMTKCPVLFAHPAKKKAYEDAYAVSAMSAFEEATKRMQTGDGFALERFTSALAEPTQILKKRGEILADLRADVVNWCFSGQLFAFAFEHPRKLENAPVELPLSAWKGRVQWDQSVVEAQGIKFVEVRMLTASMMKDVRLKYRSSHAASGRPSVVADVQACIEEIEAEGLIDQSKPKIWHVRLIQARYEARAKAHKLKKQNVGEEVVRRVFSQYINDLKGV